MGERRRFCPALDLCRSDLNLSLCSHIVFRHSMTFLLTSECHLHVFQKEDKKHLSCFECAIETAAFESAAREGANALAGGAAWKARLHTLLRGL